MLLHDLDDFADLIAVTARDLSVDPGLVEKDYWIMQSLWGLQQLKLRFELKGGTSLSKGFGLIDRFSEDIDILIHPADEAVPVGPNQVKPQHVQKRCEFYDGLAATMKIDGIVRVERDKLFDDDRMRSAGIRLHYKSINPLPTGVKTGVLLEAGFDQVSPNRPCDISSWVWQRAQTAGLEGLTDNRALAVRCYEPGYTLVEKLQTISTKFRKLQESGEMPVNFMRHYYDVYCLLGDISVQNFLGTDEYKKHKAKRFPQADNQNISQNPAFLLADEVLRNRFVEAYRLTQSLYYRGQPSLVEILQRIAIYFDRL